MGTVVSFHVLPLGAPVVVGMDVESATRGELLAGQHVGIVDGRNGRDDRFAARLRG